MSRQDLRAGLTKDFEDHFKRGTPTPTELKLMEYGYILGRDAAAQLLTNRNRELERLEGESKFSSLLPLRNNILALREEIKLLGEDPCPKA